MSDTIVLVCAVLAALTLGVLTAYGVCLMFFRMFRVRTVEAVIETAVVVPQVLQG